MQSDLTTLTAIEAATAVRERRISALSYAEALLDRTARFTYLNAYITQTPEKVREHARLVDQRLAAGDPVGAFGGLLVCVKDNIETAGIRTTAGAFAVRDYVPTVDAAILRSLLAADASLAGKTNMHELAFAPTGFNPTWGAVGNPYDRSRSAGGSSGGSAAAVAGRMATFALGTDTGGSCRIPAALCGCVGFRPTAWRYRQDGLILLSRTRDTAGLFTRTVEDATWIDSICSMDQPDRMEVDVKGLRIGVPRDYFYDRLDGELATAIDQTLQAIATAGAVLVERDLPQVDTLAARTSAILTFEIPRELRAFLDGAPLSMTLEQLTSRLADDSTKRDLQEMIRNPTSERAYRSALDTHRQALQNTYAEYFSDNNVAAIAVPTTPSPAPLIDGPAPSPRNTNPPSIAGLPCLSIPVGLTRTHKLPVGMELVGPGGSDALILGIACAIEKLVGTLPPPS